MIVLEGSLVRLRPFEPAEFDVLWGAVSGADPTVAVGKPDADGLRTRVEASGRLTERELLLAVEAERRLVGSIQAYRKGVPAGVFELGIELFEERDRGHGFGAEAVALLVEHLFDSQGRVGSRPGRPITTPRSRWSCSGWASDWRGSFVASTPRTTTEASTARCTG